MKAQMKVDVDGDIFKEHTKVIELSLEIMCINNTHPEAQIHPCHIPLVACKVAGAFLNAPSSYLYWSTGHTHLRTIRCDP